MRQLLFAALTLAAMSTAASAEPSVLAESQLDAVTAGQIVSLTGLSTAFFAAAATHNTVAIVEFSNVLALFEVDDL